MENYSYTESKGDPANSINPYRSERKMPAALLAILLGAFGIHKFYLGYTQEGIILLISTLIILPILIIFTCGVASFLYPVVFVIPLIEGIIYLTMSDQAFDQTYVNNKKPWF